MTKQTVHIPRPLVNQLLHLAQLSPSQPICGLIGRKGDDTRCYPLDVATTDASVLFALNASEQITALKQLEANGQQLFAIYHSHPESPAIPSHNDIEDADYPDALYLIISLNTKGVLEMRGFYLRKDGIEEVDLGI